MPTLAEIMQGGAGARPEHPRLAQELEALRAKGLPAWVQRASDPNTPQTEDGETMRSGSSYSAELGGEVLYPTIRLGKDGALYRPQDPYAEAISKGDFVLVKGPPGQDTADLATGLSKRFSDMVGSARSGARPPAQQGGELDALMHKYGVGSAPAPAKSGGFSLGNTGLAALEGVGDLVQGIGTVAGSIDKSVTDYAEGQLGADSQLYRALFGEIGNFEDRPDNIADTTKRLLGEAGAALRGGAADVLGGSTEDYKYTPTVKSFGDIDTIGEAGTFAAENFAASIPLMIAAAGRALPLAIGSVGGSIAEERAKNNSEGQRTIPTPGEAATGMGVAIPSMLAERFATRGLADAAGKALGLGAGTAASKAAGGIAAGAGGGAAKSVLRSAKGAGTQVLTEGGQEGFEELGGTVGTDKGATWKGFLHAVGSGMLVGSIPGSVHAALEQVSPRAKEGEPPPELSEEEARAAVMSAAEPKLRELGWTDEQIAAASPDFVLKALAKVDERRAEDADPGRALRQKRSEDGGDEAAQREVDAFNAERTPQHTPERAELVKQLQDALETGDEQLVDTLVAKINAVDAPAQPETIAPPPPASGRAKEFQDRADHLEQAADNLRRAGQEEDAQRVSALAKEARTAADAARVGDDNTKAAVAVNSPSEPRLPPPEKMSEPPRDPAMSDEEVAHSRRKVAAEPQRSGTPAQAAARKKAIEAAERKVEGLGRRRTAAKTDAAKKKVDLEIAAAEQRLQQLRDQDTAIGGTTTAFAGREGGTVLQRSEAGRANDASAFALAERQKGRVETLREEQGTTPKDDKPASFEETNTPQTEEVFMAEGRPVEVVETFPLEKGAPRPLRGRMKVGNTIAKVQPLKRDQETGRLVPDPDAEPFIVPEASLKTSTVSNRPRMSQDVESRRGRDKLDDQNATFVETAPDPATAPEPVDPDGPKSNRPPPDVTPRSDRPVQGPGPRMDAPSGKSRRPEYREEDLAAAEAELDEKLKKDREQEQEDRNADAQEQAAEREARAERSRQESRAAQDVLKAEKDAATADARAKAKEQAADRAEGAAKAEGERAQRFAEAAARAPNDTGRASAARDAEADARAARQAADRAREAAKQARAKAQEDIRAAEARKAEKRAKQEELKRKHKAEAEAERNTRAQRQEERAARNRAREEQARRQKEWEQEQARQEQARQEQARQEQSSRSGKREEDRQWRERADQDRKAHNRQGQSRSEPKFKPTSDEPLRGGENSAPGVDKDGYVVSKEGGPIAFNPKTQKLDYAKLILELRQMDPDGRYDPASHPYFTFKDGFGTVAATSIRKTNHEAKAGDEGVTFMYSLPMFNPKVLLDALGGKETIGDLIDLLKSSTSLLTGAYRLVGNELRALMQNARDVAEVFRSFGDGANIPKSLKDTFASLRRVANIVAFTNDEALRWTAKVSNSTKLMDVRKWLQSSLDNKQEGQTFHEALAFNAASRLNRAQDALDSVLRAVSRGANRGARKRAAMERLADRLRTGDTSGASEVELSAMRAIRQVLNDALARMQAAGIDIGEARDYFPRILDDSLVRGNRGAFIAAATKAYMADGMSSTDAKASAEAWYDAVLSGEAGTDGQSRLLTGSRAGVSDTERFESSRTLGRAADKLLKDFYVRDINEIMSRYLLQAERRIQLAKKFGPDLKGWQEVIKDIEDNAPNAEVAGKAIAAAQSHVISALGLSNTTKSQTTRRVTSWLSYAQGAIFLTQSSFSAVTEPLLVGLRTGNVFDSVSASMETLNQLVIQPLRAMKNDQRMRDENMWWKLSEDIGIVSQSVHDIGLEQRYFGGEGGTSASRRATNRLFRYIGMHHIDQSSRVASAKLGMRFILRSAELVGTKSFWRGQGKRDLLELGVPADKLDAFVEYANKHLAQGMEPDLQERLQHEKDPDAEMRGIMRTAMGRFNDQVIQRPTPAVRQRLAQTPLGRLVYGLQGFITAFQKNVINRHAGLIFGTDYNFADRETMTRAGAISVEAVGRARQAAIVGTYMAGMYVAQGFVTGIRDDLFEDPATTDKEREARRNKPFKLLGMDMGVTDGEARIMSRVGLFGMADWPMNVLTNVRYNRDFATSISGPVVSQGLETVDAVLTLLNSEKNSDKTNTAERRAVRAAYMVLAKPILTAAVISMPGSSLTGSVLKAAMVQGVGHPIAREEVMSRIAGPKRRKTKGGSGLFDVDFGGSFNTNFSTKF